MSKLLVIFGVSGNQGGSVCDFVLNDPELSKEFKIRGITRNPSQDAAKALESRGVEITSADLDDAKSVQHALQGAHTVFGVTTTVYDDQLKEREYNQGKAMADAAVAVSAKYLIFSTLTSPRKVTNGKLIVDSFDVKAEIEDYIRGLPIPSAFFDPGGFMENFLHSMGPRRSQEDPDTYSITNIVTPDTKLPSIAIARDTGKYVGAILAEPEKFKGRTMSASTDLYSFKDIARIIGEATGKKVTYNQIPADVFKGFMPPVMGKNITNMMLWVQDPGYYGPDTQKLVAETAKQARGKLTTLEEFFRLNPLKLK